jgi:hypothetical protein
MFDFMSYEYVNDKGFVERRLHRRYALSLTAIASLAAWAIIIFGGIAIIKLV